MAAGVSGVRGATALVTGASDGVGLEIARALAAEGAHVLMPVRNREKGERAVERIRATVPDAHLSLRDLDLARLDTVDALVHTLRADDTSIDLYVMNAGTVQLGDPQRHVTPDGFELHFQTNFVGHAVLTLGLLPLLRGSHIAVQCSLAVPFGRLPADLSAGHGSSRYTPLRAYAASKLALGLFGVELARRTPDARVGICHPGIAPGTAIAPRVRDRLPAGFTRWVTAHVGNPPAEAALPALTALRTDDATPRRADGAPTVMFAPRGVLGMGGPPRERPLFRRLRDPAAAHRVWEFAQALAEVRAQRRT